MFGEILVLHSPAERGNAGRQRVLWRRKPAVAEALEGTQGAHDEARDDAGGHETEEYARRICPTPEAPVNDTPQAGENKRAQGAESRRAQHPQDGLASRPAQATKQAGGRRGSRGERWPKR